MNKVKVTAICGALSVSMLASVLAGCGDSATEKIDGTQTAVTINGEAISVGEANMLLRYNEAHTLEMLDSYGFTYSGDLWDKDYSDTSSSSEDEDEVDYTGETPKTYGDGLKKDTINAICEMVLLRQQAEDYDVTIPEGDQSELELAAKYEYKFNEDLFNDIGITQDDVQDLLELEAYQKYVKEAMIADTDRDVSEDEAKQRKLTYVRAWTTTTDDDGNEVAMSDDEIASLKKEMKEVLADIQAADDPAEADISELQKAVDEDNLSTGTYAYSYDEGDVGLCEEVHEVVQKLKDGEVYDKVIEADGALYLIRLDAAVDPERTEYKKESIISDRETENYKSKMEPIRDEAKVEVSSYWKKNIIVTDKNSYQASSGANSANGEAATEGTESVSSTSAE